ncbi:MAG: hypothetical protein PHH71_02560 [Clostridia bacterium]|jgi:CBS domain containing-hemolysin-like protein|nr:hypothetical protein [Clostridia bacterium]
MDDKSKQIIGGEKIEKKKDSYWRWPIRVFFLAFTLSLLFGITSEHFMSGAGLFLAIFIVIILITISILTDMIGVAVVACNKAPFEKMASKNVKGAEYGLYIVKNSAKIASLCADVVGDVCGVLSGAAGATILSFLIYDNSTSACQILIAALVSATIAGVTIGGKAVFKQYATNNAEKIVLVLGKILNVFSRIFKK